MEGVHPTNIKHMFKKIGSINFYGVRTDWRSHVPPSHVIIRILGIFVFLFFFFVSILSMKNARIHNISLQTQGHITKHIHGFCIRYAHENDLYTYLDTFTFRVRAISLSLFPHETSKNMLQAHKMVRMILNVDRERVFYCATGDFPPIKSLSKRGVPRASAPDLKWKKYISRRGVPGALS